MEGNRLGRIGTIKRMTPSIMQRIPTIWSRCNIRCVINSLTFGIVSSYSGSLRGHPRINLLSNGRVEGAEEVLPLIFAESPCRCSRV